MTQKTERQVLIWAGAASLVLAAVMFLLTMTVRGLDGLWEPLFLVFLGLGCQCALRLILTVGFPYDHDRLFVTTSGWFQKNRLDKWILKKDPVCKWADLTSYDPEHFTGRPSERELIVQHTCTLEVVNSLNAVLAFLPLLLLLVAENKVPALIVLLVLGLLFCAYGIYMTLRARQFRFQVKAGRV